MNIDLVKSAMGAAREVLLQECGMPVEQQQIKMQNGPYETKGVTVIIGLAQDVEGSIILGMSEETACAYISHAIGEPTTEIDELAQSGLGELGNVLAGRAAAKFCERGHQTAIAPPTVLIGKMGTLSTLSIPRIVTPMHTPLGMIELQLAAKERQAA